MEKILIIDDGEEAKKALFTKMREEHPEATIVDHEFLEEKAKEFESYKKNKLASVIGMAAMCDALPGVAKARRKMNRIVKNEPPRTMTDEEKAYYAIHKTLNGFK